MKKLLTPLAVAALLLTSCGAGDPVEQASPTTTEAMAPETAQAIAETEAPSAPEEPTGIPTTGSYAADLAALGVVPDDDASYQEFMIGNMCAETGTGLGISVRSVGGNDAESGGGPEVVLLTATYFCPEQLPEIEELLEHLNE